METVKKIGKILRLNDDDGYVISIAIALIVVSVILAGYVIFFRPAQKGYMTIYMLDSEGKAANYPELLVLNQNSSFDIQVEVENHVGQSQSCEVLMKVTDKPISSFPLNVAANNTYAKTLENGETWDNSAGISIDQTGNYSVVFELWTYDETAGAYQFSGNQCVLNLEVTS